MSGIKNSIDELICQLLEEPNIKENNTVEFTDKAKTLIHEIAAKCKDIQIVKDTQDQAEEYAKGLSAEQIYVDMLNKIVEAPTKIHMMMSARMIIPIIEQKLNVAETAGLVEARIE